MYKDKLGVIMFIKCSKIFSLTLIASSVLLASSAHASEWADRTTISGFSSAVYQQSSDHTPFNGSHDTGIAEDGSFAGTRFGININSQVNDKIMLASQLLSSHENDNYVTRIDWAFVSYQVTDDVTIRTGKVKYPVGIANEYVAVGYAYPWISPPQVFYALSANGPQVTREAYTGGSVLWQKSIGDVTYSADMYGGEVALANMTIHGMKGITVRADWNDEILVQGSYYQGEMENENMAMMDGETHSSSVIGIKIDKENVVAYAEYAKVDMGMFEAGNSTAWYGSLGYRIGSFMPFANFGMYEKGEDAMIMMMSTDMMGNMTTTMVDAHNKQYVATVGVKYDILPGTDIKLEYSKIHTSAGNGLYAESGADADVNVYGVAIDVVF